ncbi:MAG: 4Fe-4S dicluster domain-containing protein [Rhodanobacteraceae bacterium]
MPTDDPAQQPCSHCGDCVHACPEALNPEALFFALVHDDFASAVGQRLDACSECNRCVEVCPSYIPLLDWFRWGNARLVERTHADTLRARYQLRNSRLTRERAERAAARRETLPTAAATLPVQTISHAEVLAAIARGKARRRSPK